MVRAVYMNIFYRMDLEISDPKSEFWTKTEKNREVEKLKNQFWGPKLTFEVVSKTEMTFKNILDHSAVIPAQFPYIKKMFLIKLAQNLEKYINVDIFYINK